MLVFEIWSILYLTVVNSEQKTSWLEELNPKAYTGPGDGATGAVGGVVGGSNEFDRISEIKNR